MTTDPNPVVEPIAPTPVSGIQTKPRRGGRPGVSMIKGGLTLMLVYLWASAELMGRNPAARMASMRGIRKIFIIRR